MGKWGEGCIEYIMINENEEEFAFFDLIYLKNFLHVNLIQVFIFNDLVIKIHSKIDMARFILGMRPDLFFKIFDRFISVLVPLDAIGLRLF
jgi:hypothetical protein